MEEFEITVRHVLRGDQAACILLAALVRRDYDFVGNPHEWTRSDVVELLRKELTDHGIYYVWDDEHESGSVAITLASKLGFDADYLENLFNA